ncbi:MAG: hypothetical protein PSX36_13380 [bacterium]|nr:hypothetical protein [bacterium]
MAGKIKTYSVHSLVALLVIGFPLLMSFIKSDNKPNLVGIVISDEKPKFSRADWLDGTYQDEMDEYTSDRWAFKELMVRLNNQFYYDAFNDVRVNNFVSGKDNYVFAEGYIFSAFGDDLLKESKVSEKLRKAKVVQDTLKRKGIDLIIGLAPGKGEYCVEYIQDKYKHPVKGTNHELFVKFAQEYGLNLLDLYDYFGKLKSQAKYPLFTKFGHHWSYYGECLAVELTIRYIEKLRNTDLPDLKWDEVEVIDSARSRDADVLKSMNLYSNPAQNMNLAYPKIMFEIDSLKNRNRVLVIGDSYWYGPVYMGVSQKCFGFGEFWYYYNRIVPTRVVGQKIEVWELDLKEEIEKNQVIMLMYADGNYPTYGNEFIDDAYELYTSPKTFYERRERKKQIQTYAKQIREIPALLKKSTHKSNDLMIPLDSAITLDAMRMAGFGK